MAFSEHLLGLSLIATPIIATTGNVLLAYNAAFFLSFPLCAIGAHLLTYQITRRHDLALVAGLAYGFAPYRMAQFAHIQVLSSYWMPFALLGLHLFVQTAALAIPRALRRWPGICQALACGYYLFYLSVLVGLWLLWFAHRTHPLGRLRPTAAGLGHRHRRTRAGRVRLFEISARVRPAPLARRDSGVQRRRRQRADGVGEPAAVGLAATWSTGPNPPLPRRSR